MFQCVYVGFDNVLISIFIASIKVREAKIADGVTAQPKIIVNIYFYKIIRSKENI